ncbi:YkgJ family cysteine cluster protein [Waterburya agarophytonicola K14]|uniref:YkgJ family cysteine cluster protein n=1 Tax=Waterburya agarophytonicola KI4 TaxID=2874699 RepID=A0A964FHA6_9CYAN|nr:YkgJ family cysteine cluster protein [Waterburya agarophytonicola KI4]
MKYSKQKDKYSNFSRWQCVNNCGACCNLTPEDRPDLAEYLQPEELALYMSMVGEDGWCINYDHDNRKCQIYEQRPGFCRVKPDHFQDMYGIEVAGFNEFAIACCQQQICGVYGDDSEELARYNSAIGNS